MFSMNNGSTYDANNSLRGVHMALMGDPPLRAHIIAPAQDFTATHTGGNAELKWTASADNIAGYNIYRKNGTVALYEKINLEIITNTFYIDSCLVHEGVYTYMVRAINLEITNSGSFHNMSTGIADTLYKPVSNPLIAGFQFIQNGNQITFTNTSQNTSTYQWNFGDGNGSTKQEPSHTYAMDGTYTISLIASSIWEVIP